MSGCTVEQWQLGWLGKPRHGSRQLRKPIRICSDLRQRLGIYTLIVVVEAGAESRSGGHPNPCRWRFERLSPVLAPVCRVAA
jgi:hypothetical protein